MKRSPISGFEHGLELLSCLMDVLLNQMKESNPILLAIAGGSCSGKSLLAQKLEEALKIISLNVSVLNFDDYYKDESHPNFPFDDAGRAIFDLPESYLLAEFRRDVELLLSGQSITSPVYDKKTNKRLLGLGREVKAGYIIVTEGLFVVQALDGMDDVLKIFIEADNDIRIARRIKRDTGLLHDTAEDTLRFIKERVEPYYQKYVAPQIEQADIVIMNND